MTDEISAATTDRTTGDSEQHYDVVVIGAGQAGGPLAGALAKAGRRVALIEREHVGGTCVNVGCTPTKTMVASANVAATARHSEGYGVMTGAVSVEMSGVRERKQRIVEAFRNGMRASLERTDGLDLIFGSARFDGTRLLKVNSASGTRSISGEIVVVNVGTRPAELHISGASELEILDSTTIMELEQLPQHLLVVGGGYVGVEFAQMFRRYGSEVTLVQKGPQILAREDPDIASVLEEILVEDGIEVVTNAEVASLAGTGDGIELTVRASGQERRIEGSHLLAAVGRRPNTENLGLEEAAVELDERGYVAVDEYLRTSAEGIFAVGDVAGSAPFTHVSYDDYRIVREQLLDGSERSTRTRLVPYTIYTDPQLGRVGMSEKEAKASGRRVGIARMPAGRVARAIETGNERGLWKAIVDLDSEEILGAAILGFDGGEIMSVVQVAMVGKLSYKQLRDGVFAHPTSAESLNNLFGKVEPI